MTIVIHADADSAEWIELKYNLMDKYKMADNSDSQFILGMKIERDGKSLKITQQLQINKVLNEFNMADCKPKSTPSEVSKLTKGDCPQTDDEIAEMKSV